MGAAELSMTFFRKLFSGGSKRLAQGAEQQPRRQAQGAALPARRAPPGLPEREFPGVGGPFNGGTAATGPFQGRPRASTEFSFEGRLDEPNRAKRSASSGGFVGALEEEAPKKRRVHVYLPGLAAFDENHTKAALLEMNQPNTSTGTIFVESKAAKKSAKLKISDFARKKGFDSPKIKVISSDLSPIEKNPSGPRALGQSEAGDILVVKTHGSPKNKKSVMTRVTLKEESVFLDEETEGIPANAEVSLTHKFEIRHTAKRIAKSVNGIAKMLSAESLDVRLTSCGSAGTVDSEAGKRKGSLSQSFAGQVSHELDELDAAEGVKVSGFLGDANSTFPVSHHRSKTFVTKVRQRNRSSVLRQNSKLFRERFGSKSFQLDVDEKGEKLTEEQITAVSPKFSEFDSEAERKKKNFGPELEDGKNGVEYKKAFIIKDNDWGDDRKNMLVASRRRSLARVSVPRRPRAPQGGGLDTDG